MWGHTGVYCIECRAEWNYTWHTERKGELVICPNCQSKEVAIYPQTIPFAIGGGGPPDYVYNCICGSVFQYPPKHIIDPFEQDIKKLSKVMEITCPFCHRNNKSSWYIPKE
jgi:DNA-directed RNA polymerase subunit RPC12/RpoP